MLRYDKKNIGFLKTWVTNSMVLLIKGTREVFAVVAAAVYF